MTVPALFVSHGAPTLALDDGPTARFLRGLGAGLDRPTAVLCASAHWRAATPQLTGDEAPATVHDFSGFGDALGRMRYPAAGDPALARRAVEALRAAGIAADVVLGRGLDHGAWVPLSLLWPEASLPVVQIALTRGDARAHLAIGRALAPLRADGVLVLGSGGASHNLGELDWTGGDGDPPEWVATFERWLVSAVEAGRVDDLVRWRELAPDAQRNHPTDEHLLPLFVALGAGGGRGRVLHAGTTYGALSMACFAFDG